MDVRVQSLVGGVMWQNDVTKLKSDLPQIIVGKKEIVKKKKKKFSSQNIIRSKGHLAEFWT